MGWVEVLVYKISHFLLDFIDRTGLIIRSYFKLVHEIFLKTFMNSFITCTLYAHKLLMT